MPRLYIAGIGATLAMTAVLAVRRWHYLPVLALEKLERMLDAIDQWLLLRTAQHQR